MLAALVATGAPCAPPFDPWVPAVEQQLQSVISAEVVAALRRPFESSVEGSARLDQTLAAHAAEFQAFVERARPVKEEWDLSLRLRGSGGQKPDKYEAEAKRVAHLSPLADEQFALDERFLSQVQELMIERGLCCWDEVLLEVNSIRWRMITKRTPEATVNLIDLCRAVGADILPSEEFEAWWDSEAVRGLRSRYAMDQSGAIRMCVDGAIVVARNRARLRADQAMTGSIGAVGTGGDLGRRIEAAVVQMKRAVEQLRANNRMYLEQFGAVLPGGGQGELVARYWERAIDAEREPCLRAAADAVSRLLAEDSLSAEQRAAIFEMRAQFRSSVAAPARRSMDEVHRIRTSGEGSIEANDVACAAALEAVRQATESYLAAIANVLSPEQRAAFEAARTGPTTAPGGRAPIDGRK